MSVQKVLANNAGLAQEIPVGVQVSLGASSAGQAAVLNSAGVFDVSFYGPGIGQEVAVVPTSEAISAGAFVNIWNNSGTGNVRNASASSIATRAVGYVLQGYSSGANATVYFTGSNSSVTGAIPGTVWLGTSPGSIASTPPTGAGVLCQILGTATSSTNIAIGFGNPIIQAA